MKMSKSFKKLAENIHTKTAAACAEVARAAQRVLERTCQDDQAKYRQVEGLDVLRQHHALRQIPATTTKKSPTKMMMRYTSDI